MQTIAKDYSIIEAVFRRRKRSVRLSELARDLVSDVLPESLLDETESLDSGDVSGEVFAEPREIFTSVEDPVDEYSVEVEAAIETEAAVVETPEESMTNVIENEIDEGLIGDLGATKCNYGMLEELIPQLDFGTIPFTQPNRVMAKNGPSGQSITSGENIEEVAKKVAVRRKRKSETLLNSYFKDL